MSKNLGLVAARYAEKLGFYVFPLKEKAKVPATTNGLYAASDVPEIIHDLWSPNSQYNIGLRTGFESGVFVLDVDGKDGVTDLAALEERHGSLPQTTSQKTSNGFHLIFKYPTGADIGNRARLIKHTEPNGGLDVRGTGGYIVLAPSVHPDTGLAYEWINKPTSIPPADAPEWLIEIVRKKEAPILSIVDKTRIASPQLLKSTSPATIIADQIKAISEAPEGTRNHTLNIAALKCGRVVAGCPEIGESEVLNNLLSAAIGAGLEHGESEATIMSGFKAGLAQPYQYGGLNTNYSLQNSQQKQISPLNDENKEDQPFVNKFNVLGFNDVINSPKLEWVVDGVFPKQSFGVIYGMPEKGKTFVALDMALHIAHGMEWRGHRVVQGSVLYIAGEGVGGLPKRLKAWTYQNGLNHPAPPFYTIAANVNMREPEDVEHIIKGIQSIGSQFSVIFIDTVARALLGGDENSSTDMGLFVSSCDKIKDATGATVIGVHHSGKDADRGMRGSSALLGAVDTVIQVTQEVRGHIVLVNEKQKDGEPFKDMHFKTAVITTGITDTSIVIEEDTDVMDEVKASGKKQDMALQFLYDCIASDTVTMHGCPATSLEKWKLECDRRELGGDTEDAKKKSFQRAKKRLQESRIIACENRLVWVCKEDV